MKYLYFFLFLFFFSHNSFSQDAYLMAAVDTAPVIEECYDSKDTKDCFNESLSHHIRSNLDIRKTFHSAGKAYVQFKITEDGKVQDVKVRAEDDKHREEAKRVIELLKIRQPATLNGENVAVLHSLPITFRTKNYNSIEEYHNSEDFKKVIENKLRRQKKERREIVAFEQVKFPPEHKECLPIPDKKDCFGRFTEIKLRMHLQKENPDLKPGTEIRYFFQIDKEGKTSNVIVNTSGKLTNRIARDFLQDLSFESPARNEEGDPVKTEFSGRLVF